MINTLFFDPPLYNKKDMASKVMTIFLAQIKINDQWPLEHKNGVLYLN